MKKKEANFISQFKRSHKYFSTRQTSHFGKQKCLLCASHFILHNIQKAHKIGQNLIIIIFTALSKTILSETRIFLLCLWGRIQWLLVHFGNTVFIPKVPVVYLFKMPKSFKQKVYAHQQRNNLLNNWTCPCEHYYAIRKTRLQLCPLTCRDFQ